MTRSRKILLGILLFVATVVFSADFLLARILSAQLPSVLERLTSKPVKIDELTTHILSLRAQAELVRLGNTDPSALLVEQLTVELDGTALLRGELRFRAVEANSATIDLLKWQGDGGDTPVDRARINRWLPDHITVGTLALYADESLQSLTENNRWQKLNDSQQQLSWQQAGLLSPISVIVRFSPIFELLEEQRGNIQVELVRSSHPDDVLSAEITVAPATQGVLQTVEVDTLAVSGSWTFESDDLLAWPQSSVLKLSMLDIDQIRDISEQLSNPTPAEDRDWLQAPLPELELPSHQVEVTIDELTLDDETMTNVSTLVAITAAEDSNSATIEAKDLSLQMPNSNLTGSFSLNTGDQWQVALELNADAQDRDEGLMSLYEDSDWRWHGGHAELASKGSTSLELFQNARGSLDVGGVYHGVQELPMRLQADFKSERGLMGSDALTLQIGESIITGALWTDETRRALNARLTSPYFNLDDLQDGEQDTTVKPDTLRIPDLSWFPSDLPIDIVYRGEELLVDGRRMLDVDAIMQHTAKSVSLQLDFATSNGGSVSVEAAAERLDGVRTLALDATMSNVDPSTLGVGLPMQIQSASLQLAGQGQNLPDIVPQLRGKLGARVFLDSLTAPLTVQTNPRMSSDNDILTALFLDELKINLGDVVAAQGNLNINLYEAGLYGELQTPQLNVDDLIAETKAGTDPNPVARQLENLIPMRFALNIEKLNLQQQVIDNVALTVTADTGVIRFEDGSFTSNYGAVQWQGRVTKENDAAKLDLSGELTGLLVSSFSDTALDLLDKPLHGLVEVRTAGVHWSDMIEDAVLRLQLSDDQATTNTPAEFEIDVELQPRNEGLYADVAQIKWRGSDARGTVYYKPAQPPTLRADIVAGKLDLTEFSTAEEETVDDKQTRGGLIRGVASTAQRTLGFLSSTLRTGIDATGLGTDSGPLQEESDRFFNQQTWSLDPLSAVDADIRVSADRVLIPRGEGRDVEADLTIAQQHLKTNITSANANGGPLQFSLSYDGAQAPPAAHLVAILDGVRPSPDQGVAPLSAYIDLTASGASESTLASSLSGPFYASAGRGVTQFSSYGAGILTGDLIQNIFAKLLPSSDEAPRLSCAIGYAELLNGAFSSPSAIVFQTAKANVLVQAQVDLAEESISAQFDSRSRTGTGLSVGNVFSNTVRLEGDLIAPKIVTNKKSLLWRYGAAVATGGLSLVGESVYKRVMADKTPCTTMKKTLQEQVCQQDSKVANAALICG